MAAKAMEENGEKQADFVVFFLFFVFFVEWHNLDRSVYTLDVRLLFLLPHTLQHSPHPPLTLLIVSST